MELQEFNFNGMLVQAMEIDGEAYVLGKNVADILGYTNPAKAIRDHVDEEDKLTERFVLSGQNRNVSIINESGVYSLALRSKLPKAKEFKRWVTSEVLPSVRKHGAYMTNQTIDSIMTDPDNFIKLVHGLSEERKKKEQAQQQVIELNEVIEEQAPKVTYYDLILENQSTMTIRSIANDYGMTSNTMNKLLHDKGVQYKQGKTWFLYREHIGKGYGKTHHYNTGGRLVPNLKWTQKGRLFLYDLLKADGILPLIEQEN